MKILQKISDAWLTGKTRIDNIILPSESGHGIAVGQNRESWTWRDLEGPIRPRETGVGRPTLTTWRTPIKEYVFAANDVTEITFHWPHDWVKGSNVFLHVHWSHTGSSISGDLVMSYAWTFAVGHNREVFPAASTFTHTISTPNITTYPAYQHNINEAQFSSATPAAGQIDTDSLDIDGLLIIQASPTTIPTLGGGGQLFIHYIDLHYQSSNIGTINKEPSFWA